MISFLKSRFNRGPLTEDEEKLYGELLVSFCGNTDMQHFIATNLAKASKSYQLFFLEAIANCPAKEFPVLLTKQIGAVMQSSADPLVRSRALQLIGLRGITTLSAELRQVADDKNSPADLRIDAISVLLQHQPVIRSNDFTFLYEQLKMAKDAPLRKKLADVLGKGKLPEDQLQILATEYLPASDDFILPRIVPLFAGAHSASIGRSLSSKLLQSPALDGFTDEEIKKVFEKYPAELKPAVDELLAKLEQVRSVRLKRLQQLESQISKGVLDRGRQLFFGKATCSVCHTIGDQGGHFGPDLTSIQRDRSAHDLLEAIVYPAASFVREFETYKVITPGGEHTGILKERSPDALVLNTAPDNFVRLSPGEIQSVEVQNISMMPQGLDKLLSEQEMADLMTFLLGQDQDPETDQRILR